MPGLFYLMLGCYLGQWLCEVERFDPQSNQWSMIAPMHHSRTGVAVTALKGRGRERERERERERHHSTVSYNGCTRVLVHT